MNQIVLIETIQIVSNPLNPRKVVDQNSIIELAESIKSTGLLQPVTVRPKVIDDTMPENNVYELVLGSRRLAAMKLLEWESIPCIVKELNDDETLEAMIVENLQREDISPLEEANAFNLLFESQVSYSDIAAKFGKSELFVRGRIKLLNLIPEFVLMLTEERVNLSHAYEICKLNQDIQKSVYELHYSDHCDKGNDWNQLTIPVLREKLSNQLYSLADVDFDKRECFTCVHNTSTKNTLFSNFEEERCSFFPCFQKKKEDHIIGEIEYCHENDIPVMMRGSNPNIIEQLASFGITNPLVYLSSKYDVNIYPAKPVRDLSDDTVTDQDFSEILAAYQTDIDTFEEISIKNGFKKAYTTGMIKSGTKYLYYKEIIQETQKVNRESEPIKNTSEVVKDAIVEEQAEIAKLEKKDTRNKELANEKTISGIKEMFKSKDYALFEPLVNELEDNIFIGVVLNLCTSKVIELIKKRFMDELSYIENIVSLTPNERSIIKRSFIRQLLLGTSIEYDKDVQEMLIALTSNFYSIETEFIVKQFKDEYEKKKEKIDVRIKKLKGE